MAVIYTQQQQITASIELRDLPFSQWPESIQARAHSIVTCSHRISRMLPDDPSMLTPAQRGAIREALILELEKPELKAEDLWT